MDRIYFTGSGTEADNWAIKGSAWARQYRGKHIITSQIEHPAVLNSCKWLEKQGFEVTYLPVDGEGFVKLDELEKALRKDTILVSIMFANNEVGAIQPVRKIAEIVKKNSDALFHVDAVQAVGAVKVDVKEIGCDMLTVSAHKFYGPKGIGALFIRNGLKIDKLIIGGGQERAFRSGTENTPGICGFGLALDMATGRLSERTAAMQKALLPKSKSSYQDAPLHSFYCARGRLCYVEFHQKQKSPFYAIGNRNKKSFRRV